MATIRPLRISARTRAVRFVRARGRQALTLLGGWVGPVLARTARRWPALGPWLHVERAETVRQSPEELAPPAALSPGQLANVLLALRDPAAEVAVDAARTLRAGGGGSMAPLLEVVENLEGFFHPVVRAAALETLAHLLPGGSGSVLADAAADPDLAVSLAAIGGLVARRDPLASDVLLSIVENLSGFYLPEARLAAARGLEALGVSDSQILNQLSSTEANPEIRQVLSQLTR